MWLEDSEALAPSRWHCGHSAAKTEWGWPSKTHGGPAHFSGAR